MCDLILMKFQTINGYQAWLIKYADTKRFFFTHPLMWIIWDKISPQQINKIAIIFLNSLLSRSYFTNETIRYYVKLF